MAVEQVVVFVRQLTPREKIQRIARIIPNVEAVLAQVDAACEPLRSGYGVYRDLAQGDYTQRD